MNPFLQTATACPLRGKLGETRYVHLRPTGERAIEAALLIPATADRAALLGNYFQLFGQWPVSSGTLSREVQVQLADQLRERLLLTEVLLDEAIPMTRHPGAIITVLDAGVVVAREGADASVYALRNWAARTEVTV
jgi:hypothetical protein